MTTIRYGPDRVLFFFFCNADERAAKGPTRGVAGHFSPQVNRPGFATFHRPCEGSRIGIVRLKRVIDMMCAWGTKSCSVPETEGRGGRSPRQHAMVDLRAPENGPGWSTRQKIFSLVDEGAWALLAKTKAPTSPPLSVPLARCPQQEHVLVAKRSLTTDAAMGNPDVQGTVPVTCRNLDTSTQTMGARVGGGDRGTRATCGGIPSRT